LHGGQKRKVKEGRQPLKKAGKTCEAVRAGKKNNNMIKEELVKKVGMQFDEVAELFSEKTLSSMLMTNIVEPYIVNGEARNCSCDSNCRNCGSAVL